MSLLKEKRATVLQYGNAANSSISLGAPTKVEYGVNLLKAVGKCEPRGAAGSVYPLINVVTNEYINVKEFLYWGTIGEANPALVVTGDPLYFLCGLKPDLDPNDYFDFMEFGLASAVNDKYYEIPSSEDHVSGYDSNNQTYSRDYPILGVRTADLNPGTNETLDGTIYVTYYGITF